MRVLVTGGAGFIGIHLTKRLLAVIDKESLAVRRLATAGRFAPGWVDATKAQQTELLH